MIFEIGGLGASGAFLIWLGLSLDRPDTVMSAVAGGLGIAVGLLGEAMAAGLLVRFVMGGA